MSSSRVRVLSRGWRGAALWGVGGTTVVALATLLPGEQRPLGGPRTVDVTYVATIDAVPERVDRLRLWLPTPQSDAHQQIDRLEVDAPYPTTVSRDPEFGNTMVYLSVPKPDRHTIQVSLRFRVTRREQVTDASATSADAAPPAPDPRWLAPDRLVPLDARIRGLAAEVTRGRTTDLEKVRAIYDYVVSTMRYDKSGTGWGNGDIYWACDTQSGNCTDFHAVFTGLARAVGIPAKFVIGFPLPPDGRSGRVEGYHCWAEFYLDDVGWVPVDTSEASLHPEKREYFFGAVDSHRVLFTVGRDVRLEPVQAGAPLNFFIYPYAEVDDRPFPHVRWTLHVEDLGHAERRHHADAPTDASVASVRAER